MSAKNTRGRESVMVIGGGIAGIQASLDLAKMGFQVDLVEKSPSLGGRMAQLDKTFPTNDCAMCILAPKMIECASHENVRLFTSSQVENVEGQVGSFKVKVRKRAPRVDWTRCTGCGLCEAGCPIELPNEFDVHLGTRKAIYIPFPQAVPKKYSIEQHEKRPCNAACMYACPAETNTLGYIALIARRRYEEAYLLIRETNPFPSVCGRVCFAPCEKVCSRGQIDEPVAIRDLKRFCADQVDIAGLELPAITRTGKKVAVIGAGPGGLSAANHLALRGHTVTVLEALPEAGGLLRYGIPSYRLPNDVLDLEIDNIRRLGVDIRTGVEVGTDITLEAIRAEHDAVFLAMGAYGEMTLGAPGEDLGGVYEGVRFLREANMGKDVTVGQDVAIVGGGNTAMDCARTLRRLGAETVTVVYRRSRAEMPAAHEEIEAAIEEGVRFEFLTTPVRFHGENGRVVAMECIRMELGEPDQSGRRRPVPVEGSEFRTPVDMVVAAIGQYPTVGFVSDVGISLSSWGSVECDRRTGATKVAGVFAGGDVVTGAAYVIDAIAAGVRAAASIDRYLKGQPVEAQVAAPVPAALGDAQIAALKQRFARAGRAEPEEQPAERARDFREVRASLTEEQAVAEARRCLAGAIRGCIQCHECERRCEAGAIRYDMEDEVVEVEVGAIVLATGLDLHDVTGIEEYGYGRVANVITAMEFERLTSASGPTFGALRRASDGKIPHSLAFIQCVGSRDSHSLRYCSSVCCMHATKEAILAYEHHPGTRSTIFYMDMRAVGKRFQEYIARARAEYQVEFMRARPGAVEENPANGNPIVWYEDTSTGRVQGLEVEMVVLSQAMVPSRGTKELAEILRIELDEAGFVRIPEKLLSPVDSTRPGVLACGYVHSPRDIPDSVVQGSSAAARAAELLAGVS